MTVDQEFADNVIRNNGYYNGDSDNTFGDNPRAVRIVEYTNAWGNQAFGISLEGEALDYYLMPSEFIQNPKVIWDYES